MNVVISQSMFFPWVGFLEQVQLADIFIFYDDVPFSKGSFTNRVQIKTVNGPKWLTVPLEGLSTGQKISEVRIKEKSVWVKKHLAFLEQSFSGAPFSEDAINLVEKVYQADFDSVGELARISMLALFDYFDLTKTCKWIDVEKLSIPGKGSDRVLSIVQAVNGKNYITGYGAKNYLNHEMFESSGIKVKYMDYHCLPYKQLYGAFMPYVSALDLIANCGKRGVIYLKPDTVDWKEFI